MCYLYTPTMTFITLPLLNGTNQRNFLTVVYSSVYSKPANMSFVDTLRQWDEAVTCINRQDFSKALEIFLGIQEPNSKIYFDIGCLHLLDQDFDAAEKVCLICRLKHKHTNINSCRISKLVQTRNSFDSCWNTILQYAAWKRKSLRKEK